MNSLFKKSPQHLDGGNSGPERRTRWDWIFLLPLTIACIVAFLRFPLLQNDDHLKVIRVIAQEWRWPLPGGDPGNQAQHTLVHHTAAAVIFKSLELLGRNAPLKPERGAQLLSLLWALGIIPVVWLTLRRLIQDRRARVLAFLIFGTFAGWVCSAVTIDNDMAMSFWANLALLNAVIIMRSRKLPRWHTVFLLGLLIGMAVLMKGTASVMMVPVVLCFLARRWLYQEKFKHQIARILLLVLIWAVFAAPNFIRTYRATGYLIYNRSLIAVPRNFRQDTRWDYFTFRFPTLLKKPFNLNPESRDEQRTAADSSFWTRLYLTCWGLPSYLPDDPAPWAAAALYLIAFPITLVGIVGFLAGAGRMFRNPAWCPIIGWLSIGIVIMLIGKQRLILHDHARYLSFAAGGQVALLALGFQYIMKRRPRLRGVLYVLVGLLVVIFWWLLLSGPFYSFWEHWPSLLAP